MRARQNQVPTWAGGRSFKAALHQFHDLASSVRRHGFTGENGAKDAPTEERLRLTDYMLQRRSAASQKHAISSEPSLVQMVLWL